MATEGTSTILLARAALTALAQRGLDAGAVLRAVNIASAVLENLDNRLPQGVVCRIWDEAAAVSSDACFGLHAAETIPAGAFDVVDYIMAVAPTLRDGLERFCAYARLVYDRANSRLMVEPLTARFVKRSIRPSRQYDEFALAMILARSRQATGRRWTPERVAFQHHRSGSRQEVRAFFGCPVEYGQRQIELRFRNDLLAVPHVRGDSRLLSILMRYADSLLASLPVPGNVVARASSTICREIQHGLPTLFTSATALGLSPRTLQRELARHGTSHSALLDQVRRGLAMKYIGNTGLSIGEIAFLLHFSESSAFTRTFKRWTGEAPQRYRERLLYGEASSEPSRDTPSPPARVAVEPEPGPARRMVESSSRAARATEDSTIRARTRTP